jgi:hypothetical protein
MSLFLFFRKLVGKLQRCWSLLVTEEDHSQPQTQRLDSVLPSLFELSDVNMFFDKTWRQHINVANQCYVKEKVGIGYRTYELLQQPASNMNTQGESHIITEADIRCPISLDMMMDPVVGSDGHSYERSALLSYVAYRDKWNLPLTSPINPSELLNRDIMISNHHLKSLVSEFKILKKLKTDAGQGSF